MTRSSTLPEINLASPIYIVIDEHNDDNGEGGGVDANGVSEIQTNEQVKTQPELSQNGLPSSPSKGNAFSKLARDMKLLCNSIPFFN